jgi:hypothetical protein
MREGQAAAMVHQEARRSVFTPAASAAHLLTGNSADRPEGHRLEAFGFLRDSFVAFTLADPCNGRIEVYKPGADVETG